MLHKIWSIYSYFELCTELNFNEWIVWNVNSIAKWKWKRKSLHRFSRYVVETNWTISFCSYKNSTMFLFSLFSSSSSSSLFVFVFVSITIRIKWSIEVVQLINMRNYLQMMNRIRKRKMTYKLLKRVNKTAVATVQLANRKRMKRNARYAHRSDCVQ